MSGGDTKVHEVDYAGTQAMAGFDDWKQSRVAVGSDVTKSKEAMKSVGQRVSISPGVFAYRLTKVRVRSAILCNLEGSCDGDFTLCPQGRARRATSRGPCSLAGLAG
jgi:hypothetical protein